MSEKRIEQYQDAIGEAKRFIKLAERGLRRLREGGLLSGSKETAAAKRASMDLTRALAELRRGPWA